MYKNVQMKSLKMLIAFILLTNNVILLTNQIRSSDEGQKRTNALLR